MFDYGYYLIALSCMRVRTLLRKIVCVFYEFLQYIRVYYVCVFRTRVVTQNSKATTVNYQIVRNGIEPSLSKLGCSLALAWNIYIIG